MRLGVVGLGVISKYYLAAIERLPSLQLTAVCDVDEAMLAPHRGRLACYREHRSLLAHSTVDALVLTVPNDLHARICRDALLAGVPVCVEKPLCLSVSDGAKLHALSRRRGVPLFTAFHRRYNTSVRSLVGELTGAAPVDSLVVRYLERIEQHIGADAWYLDPARCGGGCVADNGPNAFDLARLLLGEVVVRGAEITPDERGVDRRALVELRAESGTPAWVELDWSYPGEVKDIEAKLRDGGVRRADLIAGHPEFKGSLWHEYVGILRDFARVVRGGHRHDDGGLAALELVQAPYGTTAVPAPVPGSPK